MQYRLLYGEIQLFSHTQWSLTRHCVIAADVSNTCWANPATDTPMQYNCIVADDDFILSDIVRKVCDWPFKGIVDKMVGV